MKRHLAALLSALVLAVITYFALHHLYASGHLSIYVGDSQGHGPDPGSLEWQGAVRGAIPFRATLGAAAVGVIAFAVAFWSLRPSHPDRST